MPDQGPGSAKRAWGGHISVRNKRGTGRCSLLVAACWGPPSYPQSSSPPTTPRSWPWFLTLRMYFYIAAIGQRGLASSWLVLAARMSRTAEDNRAAGVELCHDTKKAEPKVSNGAQGNNAIEQS